MNKALEIIKQYNVLIEYIKKDLSKNDLVNKFWSFDIVSLSADKDYISVKVHCHTDSSVIQKEFEYPVAFFDLY